MIGETILFLLLQAGQTPPSQPDLSTRAGVEAEAKSFFAGLDGNKDGKVNRAEANAYHAKAVEFGAAVRRQTEATFTGLDRDKDGSLSRQEFMAIAGSGPPANEQWLDGNDANKDGTVVLAEALARVRITFDALDSNKDGKLSAQEKAAARGAGSGRP